MKKTSKRLRSLFAALAALMLAVILTVPAFAVEGGFADLYYRMNDSAEVLTPRTRIMNWRLRWRS